MIGAQSDSIGRGAEGSESGEESGSLESRVSQSTGLVFGSIAIGVAAPEVASNRALKGTPSTFERQATSYRPT